MDIKIFDVVDDKVIESIVATGKTTYDFSLSHLFPLTDRFDFQRKIQDRKFYKRLERDITDGCVIPPITIAFVNPDVKTLHHDNVSEYVNDNISEGYILDGIQRLNALDRIKNEPGLDKSASMYLNIIIAPSEDKLLYRMITLNNGQKPMTPRHQIEMLTNRFFESTEFDIHIQTEKEKSQKLIKGAFNLSDISIAYLSFLTNEVHNENNKIIGEKMDQIIVGRIMESKPDSGPFHFKDVLKLIDKFATDNDAKKWLKVSNNLIGFSVGVKSSYQTLVNVSPEDFKESINLFDEAFKSVNPSKVNLGKYRRELSKAYFENYDEYSQMDENELIEIFSNLTAS